MVIKFHWVLVREPELVQSHIESMNKDEVRRLAASPRILILVITLSSNSLYLQRGPLSKCQLFTHVLSQSLSSLRC